MMEWKSDHSRTMRAYLAVTFWGEEYRRYFLDFCLSSLLGSGNLPAISDKSSARLLIATTDRDWVALQGEPTFLAARELISIEHVPFTGPETPDSKLMLVMSQAHKLLAQKMFEDRAQGIFLLPDMIAATGYVPKLEELWRRGFALIMSMNVRFANDGFIREIKDWVLAHPGEPIALSSSELVRLTLRHMHSEMRRNGFDNPFDDYGSSAYFWNVGSGEDLLFHCGSWLPSLIDYGALNTHDDSSLDSSTLDGDYVANNFPDPRDIYFIKDTAELFMVTFTPESSRHYSLTPLFLYRIPILRVAFKIVGGHNFLYEQAPAWLKKDQFQLPVRFRGGSAPESQWRSVESRAANIIAQMEHGGTLAAKIGYFCYFRLLPIVYSVWPNRRAIMRLIIAILRGDRMAWNHARWRVRQQITGESYANWRARHQVTGESYASWQIRH